MKRHIAMICLLLAMGAGGAALFRPAILATMRSNQFERALHKIRQVNLALDSFKNDYGHLPSKDIHEDFVHSYPIQDREDSNYLLGQLLASGQIDDERDFHVVGQQGEFTGPDRDFSKPGKILEAGECNLSYISNAEEIGHPDTPVLLTHLLPGTDHFDETLFTRKAVISTLDGSASSLSVRDGKAMLKGSKKNHLFSTGQDTLWAGRTPKIHRPLPYEYTPPSMSSLRPELQWLRPLFIRLDLTIGATFSALAIFLYLYGRRGKQS